MHMIKMKGKQILINTLIIISIVIFIPIITSAFSEGELQNTRSYIISKAMYFEIPSLNFFLEDEDNYTAKDISISNYVLSKIGLNIKSPWSILQKELVFIEGNEDIVLNKGVSLNPFSLSPEDLEKISDNPPNVVEIIRKPLDDTKPEVFIYHTHTMECYQTALIEDVSTIKEVNSSDFTRGVAGVGEVVTLSLENYGVSTLHNTTNHVAGVYSESYVRSSATLNKYMEKYKDFKLIIDIHRDSNVDREKMVKNIGGKNSATIMFVLDRSNPHFSKNEEVVNKLILISNKIYPGLCRKTYYYNKARNHFNQEKSYNSILIEVGSHVNTKEEANNTGNLLARIIAEYINGTKSTS